MEKAVGRSNIQERKIPTRENRTGQKKVRTNKLRVIKQQQKKKCDSPTDQHQDEQKRKYSTQS